MTMNKDLRTYIIAEKIALTETFNLMVYGIRKLPLIGKKLDQLSNVKRK